MAAKNNFLSPDASVLFATFSLWTGGKRMPTNGSVEPLRDFLVPRIRRLVLIDQLVPGSEDVFHKIEVYTNHSKKKSAYAPSIFFYLLWPFLKLKNYTGTHVIFKVRDFLSIIDWVIRDQKKFDYFIGLESVNACVGVLLRSLGMVKHVVYYVSDYSPHRFANLWFNRIYLWLDRFAAMHADFIWDVSPAIQKARFGAGLSPSKSAPVIHVPNGLFPNQIVLAKPRQVHPHALVYMGTVGSENGPDIAIRALAIIRKIYRDATLTMIGGKQKDFVWLDNIIRTNNLTNAVIHHGFVVQVSEMANIMKNCAVGLAPYRSIEGSPRFYGDAGKIRAYCAVGLPIVSSFVPPLGLEMEKKGVAILAKDTPKSFAEAIMKLFGDKVMYNKMRNRAKMTARTNTWDMEFGRAFAKMHIQGI